MKELLTFALSLWMALTMAAANPLVLLSGTPVVPTTPIDPSAVSSGTLVAWLRADGNVYNTGTTQALDGETVNTWDAAGGLTNDATQATSGLRPTFRTNVLNGKPVVRFDGTDDWMSNSTSITGTTFTLFVVASMDAASASNSRLASLGLTGQQEHLNASYIAAFYRVGTTNQLTTLRSGQTGPSGLGVMTMGAFYVFTLQITGSSGLHFKNGVSTNTFTTSGSFNISNFFLAASTNGANPGKADVAEAVLYTGSLSTDERKGVEAHLGTKYGITITH